MRLDGDKRPHKIVDITIHYPLNHNEHTFFQYHYEDGGSDVVECDTYIRINYFMYTYK